MKTRKLAEEKQVLKITVKLHKNINKELILKKEIQFLFLLLGENGEKKAWQKRKKPI